MQTFWYRFGNPTRLTSTISLIIWTVSNSIVIAVGLERGSLCQKVAWSLSNACDAGCPFLCEVVVTVAWLLSMVTCSLPQFTARSFALRAQSSKHVHWFVLPQQSVVQDLLAWISTDSSHCLSFGTAIKCPYCTKSSSSLITIVMVCVFTLSNFICLTNRFVASGE